MATGLAHVVNHSVRKEQWQNRKSYPAAERDPTHPQPEQGWTRDSTHMIGVMTDTTLYMLQSSTENREGNAA